MSKVRSVVGRVAVGVLVAAVAAGGYYYYSEHRPATLPDYIATGNGRIEATEYDIATKYTGRVEQVLAEEGDMVEQGRLLAVMDDSTLRAQLREAEADLAESQAGRDYAKAMVRVRNSELRYAERERGRYEKLAKAKHASQEQLDQSNTQYETAAAAAKAALIQVVQAESGIEAATARIERLNTELAETRLTSPIGGRVLYRLAEPGEVLGAGGKVMSVLDLTDVYMTIFVPTEQAGKIVVGTEARIILDAVPEYVIPAKISFVAPRTQFTPKAVETRSEREKLMFRVKVRIDPVLLKAHIEAVKTGVPGEAFVLTDQTQDWPEALHVKLP